ncbi:hypothetical protein JCM5353_000802 [Sporobolomyces roseus]
MAQPQNASNATTKQPVPRKLFKKGLFSKDLGPMMYGFGDDYNSAPDTIALMEELVIDHITDICLQASKISSNRGKIKVDDFRFALRNDPKKLARLDELLFMQEEISRARRGFENPMDYAVDEEKELEKQQAAQMEKSGGKEAGGEGGKKKDKSKKSKGKEKA